MLYKDLETFLNQLKLEKISAERKEKLQPLIAYISHKKEKQESVNLNFICTHNSRRSHLSQIWAQTTAYYCGVSNVNAYSAGTEATAVFPTILKVLEQAGFAIQTIGCSENPVHIVKYSENERPIIAFSKKITHLFNPKTQFAAIMTCSQADEKCPFVPGAENRITLPYEDPKIFDNTSLQEEKYRERSEEIAAEMLYVFSKVKMSPTKWFS
ncbi:MAG: protein-tyrosine-phosphatase [Planctomycetota bacterium]|nr:MAG: protein-tyrosine-phosphatase [Planctomycetota bacterium]